uniref:Uncharacterized protein n=1 Tax=Physcomitrium patens TaxID=3218 RepID=A0A7I4CM15_PHYPA
MRHKLGCHYDHFPFHQLSFTNVVVLAQTFRERRLNWEKVHSTIVKWMYVASQRMFEQSNKPERKRTS